MATNSLDTFIHQKLHEGLVIPAHPLALTASRQLNEARQRLLTRYYIESGAGGVAVGVHTTQFEIRNPEINLFEPVLKMAAEEISQHHAGLGFIKVAGICGPTSQALKEAEIAIKYGYHLGLLSNGGLNNLTENQLIKRAESIAEIIPLFGFYLQPAVGGRLLSYEFWKDFASIPNVQAIKIAAFNRYQTIDVVRAVCDSPRRNEIALYTGNDDNIVADLLTPYHFSVDGIPVEKHMVGGLLGHWAVWTSKAVSLLEEIKRFKSQLDKNDLLGLLSKGIAITDMNAAIFDAKNHYEGCISGINEILRRQNILEGNWCLNPNEDLSPLQKNEIDRVCQAYPHLIDDEFVRNFINQENLK